MCITFFQIVLFYIIVHKTSLEMGWYITNCTFFIYTSDNLCCVWGHHRYWRIHRWLFILTATWFEVCNHVVDIVQQPLEGCLLWRWCWGWQGGNSGVTPRSGATCRDNVWYCLIKPVQVIWCCWFDSIHWKITWDLCELQHAISYGYKIKPNWLVIFQLTGTNYYDFILEVS